MACSTCCMEGSRWGASVPELSAGVCRQCGPSQGKGSQPGGGVDSALMPCLGVAVSVCYSPSGSEWPRGCELWRHCPAPGSGSRTSSRAPQGAVSSSRGGGRTCGQGHCSLAPAAHPGPAGCCCWDGRACSAAGGDAPAGSLRYLRPPCLPPLSLWAWPVQASHLHTVRHSCPPAPPAV